MTGAARIAFHLAPAERRERILRHGLDHTLGKSGTDYAQVGTTPGNYLWTCEARALERRENQEEGSGMLFDVWAVDITGLDLIPDSYWEPVCPGSAVYCTGPIGPGRVRLHSPADDTQAA